MAIKSKNDFYSVISQALNNLEDDLQLDLGIGEDGYKTYEDSYKAVRKYTLRFLRKIEKKMRMKRIEEALVSKGEKDAN